MRVGLRVDQTVVKKAAYSVQQSVVYLVGHWVATMVAMKAER